VLDWWSCVVIQTSWSRCRATLAQPLIFIAQRIGIAGVPSGPATQSNGIGARYADKLEKPHQGLECLAASGSSDAAMRKLVSLVSDVAIKRRLLSLNEVSIYGAVVVLVFDR
jgi:hypothetical protein